MLEIFLRVDPFLTQAASGSVFIMQVDSDAKAPLPAIFVLILTFKKYELTFKPIKKEVEFCFLKKQK